MYGPLLVEISTIISYHQNAARHGRPTAEPHKQQIDPPVANG